MKINLAIRGTICLLLLGISVYCQPIGQRIRINNLYDKDLKPIVNDSNLVIGSILSSIRAFNIYYGDFPMELDQSEQRLMIIYNKDTMVVDFIIPEGQKKGGIIENIDSLVFHPGHFIYKRTLNDLHSLFSDFLRAGLTKYNRQFLINYGFMDYYSIIQLEDNPAHGIDFTKIYGKRELGSVIKNSVQLYYDLHLIFEEKKIEREKITLSITRDNNIECIIPQTHSSASDTSRGNWFLNVEDSIFQCSWRHVNAKKVKPPKVYKTEIYKIVKLNNRDLILRPLFSDFSISPLKLILENSKLIGFRIFEQLEE